MAFASMTNTAAERAPPANLAKRTVRAAAVPALERVVALRAPAAPAVDAAETAVPPTVISPTAAAPTALAAPASAPAKPRAPRVRDRPTLTPCVILFLFFS